MTTSTTIYKQQKDFPNGQSVNISGGKSLGGGIMGFIPKSVQTNNNNNEFVQTRFLLKHAWNTLYPSQMKYTKPVITPFRAVTNAGDLLSRKSYSCGGSCQTPQSRPGIYGFNNRIGHISNNCDLTLVPAASCNVKYVYDSSNYTRYMKEKAMNKNYNDKSYGGNNDNSESLVEFIYTQAMAYSQSLQDLNDGAQGLTPEQIVNT